MARSFVLFGFLFSPFILAAQGQVKFFDPVKVTFHYSLTWELTTPEKAAFRREAYFDLQDMVFDGVYQDYNANNKLIAEGIYARGEKSGIETEHFEDQAIRSTIEYSRNDFVIWQLVNEKREYDIVRGTGKFSLPYYYFFDYYLKPGTLKGEFRNGKRNGIWTYYDSKNVRTDIEYYDNGKLLKRIVSTKQDSLMLMSRKEVILSMNGINTETFAVDQTAFTGISQYFETQVAYPPQFERNVTYPGGIKHLLRLLAVAEVPDHNLAMVKIKINEHGQVQKTLIVRSVDPYTDERVLKALEPHLGRFLPAIRNGKTYPTTIYLPLGGGDQWHKLLEEMPGDWFLDVNNFN